MYTLLATELGESFLKVTPGIRPLNTSTDDQKRITTPQEAKALGSTHIVVGSAFASCGVVIRF